MFGYPSLIGNVLGGTMTIYKIKKAQQKSYGLDSDDTLVVFGTGSITAKNGYAISTANGGADLTVQNVQVAISGAVSAAGTAVMLSGTGHRLEIGVSGSIVNSTGSGPAVASNYAQDFQMNNRGVIDGGVQLVNASGSVTNSGTIDGYLSLIVAGTMDVTNSGTITGNVWAYLHSSSARSTVNFVNTGTVEGSVSQQNFYDDLWFEVENRGTIRGTSGQPAVSADEFSNWGVVIGDVSANYVYNYGALGVVYLGLPYASFPSNSGIYVGYDAATATKVIGTHHSLGDTMTGGSGDDYFDGLNGDDLLEGGLGNDTLIGDIGADRLHGGGGADELIGGFDGDILTGGLGKDRFVYRSSNDGGDTITDFDNGDDVIDLTALGISGGMDDLSIIDIGGNSYQVIYHGFFSVFELTVNVTAGQVLDETDFLF